jgi:biotin synthase
MNNLRVSAATASILNLRKWKTDVNTTTLYFMIGEQCNGSCVYCTQGNGRLSRIQWPIFSFHEIQAQMTRECSARRLCLQSLFYKSVVNDVIEVAQRLGGNFPISVSINPISVDDMNCLKAAGIERLGLGLDCCSENIFRLMKQGAPSWGHYWEAISNAADIFGHVTTHLIIGLGETDEEVIRTMQRLHEQGSDVALFAHFPLHYGSAPWLPRYRTIQAANHMIARDEGHFEFVTGTLTTIEGPISDKAFETTGCPFCNRPFYNERACGPFYNFPRFLSSDEYNQALFEVQKYVRMASFTE